MERTRSLSRSSYPRSGSLSVSSTATARHNAVADGNGFLFFAFVLVVVTLFRRGEGAWLRRMFFAACATSAAAYFGLIVLTASGAVSLGSVREWLSVRLGDGRRHRVHAERRLQALHRRQPVSGRRARADGAAAPRPATRSPALAARRRPDGGSHRHLHARALAQRVDRRGSRARARGTKRQTAWLRSGCPEHPLRPRTRCCPARRILALRLRLQPRGDDHRVRPIGL